MEFKWNLIRLNWASSNCIRSSSSYNNNNDNTSTSTISSIHVHTNTFIHSGAIKGHYRQWISDFWSFSFFYFILPMNNKAIQFTTYIRIESRKKTHLKVIAKKRKKNYVNFRLFIAYNSVAWGEGQYSAKWIPEERKLAA